jgi:MFS family permease
VSEAVSSGVTWRQVLTGPKAGTFAVLCFGVWLHAADSTVIATLLPRVVDEVGGETFIAWNFVLYRLASIAAACGTALTARRLGLRRTMVWAAIAVGVGCAISALTPNMLGMLIGRAIQGLGGGALVAATVIGVGSLFPASFTPRVMAAISAVWGSSAFLGPLVGGIFAEMGIWRVGFWVFVGQAVILAVALQLALPAGEKIDKDARRFPYRRLAVLSAAILSIASAGLAHGNTVLVAALCIAGVLGLALFVRLDRNAGEDRLLPRAIANPARGAGPGFIGIFAIAMTTIPFTVYGPILMDRVHGVGPLAVGYMIALESVAWTIGALGFAGLTGAAQTRLIRAAFAAILVSALGLAAFVASGPVWAVLPFLFLAGLGFGACFGHIVQRCAAAVPEEDRDRAGGAMPTIQAIGYALGSSICGLTANLVGYADGATLAGAEAAAFWIFVIMLPVAIAGQFIIRRLG